MIEGADPERVVICAVSERAPSGDLKGCAIRRVTTLIRPLIGRKFRVRVEKW